MKDECFLCWMQSSAELKLSALFEFRFSRFLMTDKLNNGKNVRSVIAITAIAPLSICLHFAEINYSNEKHLYRFVDGTGINGSITIYHSASLVFRIA